MNINNWRISATPVTSQEPINPCRPVEQSAGDSFRHSKMPFWSSALDLGDHFKPVVGYCYSDHTVRVRARVRTTIGVRSGLGVRVRVQSGVTSSSGGFSFYNLISR